ncbi:hypothetical protein LTR78_008651 [Recurvomyces mirabilis]|uniref:Uncharacterized protein n=1 Tax=Recurvomyces mirabilis TaxID=574656 RepID=A0AAE0WIS1_9PEZI|nr:hypothetical protein LTR78_008651 [Recurvomyces mirabilis]KAK5153438.1 hypothetical protein LTS14_007608 [Recurvomyces mirabilis]
MSFRKAPLERPKPQPLWDSGTQPREFTSTPPFHTYDGSYQMSRGCEDKSHWADHANVLERYDTFYFPSPPFRCSLCEIFADSGADSRKNCSAVRAYGYDSFGHIKLVHADSEEAQEVRDAISPPKTRDESTYIPMPERRRPSARYSDALGPAAMSRTSHLTTAMDGSLSPGGTSTSVEAELGNFWKQVPWSGGKEDQSGPYQAESSQSPWWHHGSPFRSSQPQHEINELSSAGCSMPGAFASDAPRPSDSFAPSSLTSRTATMEEIRQLRASVEKRDAQEKRETREKFRSREQLTYRERYQAEKEAVAEKKAAAAEEKRKQEDLRSATVRFAKMVLQDGLGVRRTGRFLSQLRKEAGEKTSCDGGARMGARGSETGEVVPSESIKESVRNTMQVPVSKCDAPTNAKLGSTERVSESPLEKKKTPQKSTDQPPPTNQAGGIARLWTLARERQQDVKDSRDWVQVEDEEDFVAVSKDEVMGDAEEMSGKGKKWQVVSHDGEDMAEESERDMDMS